MSYREQHELAHIRQRLRECLADEQCEAAQQVLGRLRVVAKNDVELRSEYERWRLRFDLLSVVCAA